MEKNFVYVVVFVCRVVVVCLFFRLFDDGLWIGCFDLFFFEFVMKFFIDWENWVELVVLGNGDEMYNLEIMCL